MRSIFQGGGDTLEDTRGVGGGGQEKTGRIYIFTNDKWFETLRLLNLKIYFKIAFDTRSLLLSAYIKTPQKHLNYFKKVV